MRHLYAMVSTPLPSHFPPVIEFSVSLYCLMRTFMSDRREDDLIAQCLYWFRHKLLTACTAAAVAMVIHSASGSLRYAAQFGSVMAARLAQLFPCLRCSISLSNAAVSCLRLSPSLSVALIVPCDCGCSGGCILTVCCCTVRRLLLTD